MDFLNFVLFASHHSLPYIGIKLVVKNIIVKPKGLIDIHFFTGKDGVLQYLLCLIIITLKTRLTGNKNKLKEVIETGQVRGSYYSKESELDYK